MNVDDALTLIAVALVGAVFCALQLRRALRADRHAWDARHDQAAAEPIPAAPDNQPTDEIGLLQLCRLALIDETDTSRKEKKS